MRKLSLIILLIAPLTLIAQVFIESETIPPHHLRSLATSLPFNRLRSQMDRTVSRDKKAVLAVRPHIRSTGFEVSQLSEFSKEMNLTGITDGDLVIGWADPDEEVTISGPYTLSGNLTIMNRGRLNIDEAEFSIEGDIFIMGDGEMVVTNSRFTVIQEYIYEYQATLIEQGELRFTEVAFHSSGQSWSIAMTGDARYILDHSEITDGFITTALLENATASISDTKTPGEFLCMGKNDIAFMRSDFLIFWLVLPDSSIVETALPGDSLLVNWTFPGEDMSIENIP